MIPNRKIVGEILHDYGEIRQLLVLKEPAPLVQTTALGEFSINLAIKPWVAVKDYGRTPGEINPAVLQAFAERGIEIAVPVVRQIRS